MHNLNKPSEINIDSHYSDCLNKLQTRRKRHETDDARIHQFNAAKRLALELIPNIISSAEEYDRKASEAKLCELEKLSIEEDIINHEIFQKLYEQQIVGQTCECRKKIYDKLIADAVEQRVNCPYCSTNQIKTIDHFLPQKSNGFPEFSILPINLVPACSDCNKEKLATVPSSPGRQFIHPYYEEDIHFRWLYANIEYSDNKLVCSFYVNCPEGTDETLKQRLEFQFKTLKLQNLYIQSAASEYRNRETTIKDLRKKGSAGLKEYLLEMARSCANYNINSSQTAMYYALAEDEKFYIL